MDLKPFIRDVPDFPKPGVVFKDICPLLQNPEAFSYALQEMAKPFKEKEINVVGAVESRGFIFGAPLAQLLQVSFVPLRKRGKLPSETIATSYALEYGEEQIEIHTDALQRGDKVLIVDDVLATGGTLAACGRLVEQLGGEVVGFSVLIELTFLKGRDKLRSPLFAVLKF